MMHCPTSTKSLWCRRQYPVHAPPHTQVATCSRLLSTARARLDCLQSTNEKLKRHLSCLDSALEALTALHSEGCDSARFEGRRFAAASAAAPGTVPGGRGRPSSPPWQIQALPPQHHFVCMCCMHAELVEDPSIAESNDTVAPAIGALPCHCDRTCRWQVAGKMHAHTRCASICTGGTAHGPAVTDPTDLWCSGNTGLLQLYVGNSGLAATHSVLR